MDQSSLSEVREALRHIYRSLLAEGGATSHDIVAKFQSDNEELFRGTQQRLAEIGLREIVRGLMKNPTTNLAQYDLFGIPPELRRFAPSQISVPSGRENESGRIVRKWKLFEAALLSDLRAHLAMLRDGISADEERLQGLSSVERLVAPVMAGRAGMTIGEALEQLAKKKRDAA